MNHKRRGKRLGPVARRDNQYSANVGNTGCTVPDASDNQPTKPQAHLVLNLTPQEHGMTTVEVFTYTVNDVKIETRFEKLTGLEILRVAAERGAIDGKPEDYILQSLKDDDWKYKPEDTVDLSVDNEFIALPAGSTPVA